MWEAFCHILVRLLCCVRLLQCAFIAVCKYYERGTPFLTCRFSVNKRQPPYVEIYNTLVVFFLITIGVVGHKGSALRSSWQSLAALLHVFIPTYQCVLCRRQRVWLRSAALIGTFGIPCLEGLRKQASTLALLSRVLLKSQAVPLCLCTLLY